MRRRVLIAALVACLPAAAGCSSLLGHIWSTRYRVPTANPVPEVRRVAFAPLLDGTREGAPDGFELGDAMAGELVRGFSGFDAPVRTAEVRRAMLAAGLETAADMRSATPEQVSEVLRSLDADALLVGEVTEWDPYAPPRTGLACQLFFDEGVGRAPSVDRAVLSGRPIPLPASDDDLPAAAVAEIYDASLDRWRVRLQGFARVHADDDTAFRGADAWLRDSDRWFRFCAYEMLHALFHQAAGRRADAEAGR